MEYNRIIIHFDNGTTTEGATDINKRQFMTKFNTFIKKPFLSMENVNGDLIIINMSKVSYIEFI